MDSGGLIGLAIRRPVAVMVGVILVTLFGFLSLRGLPIQLTPDIAVPTLTVVTRWPGAAPAEVEREIVEQQEEVLKNVQGLIRMTSEAADAQGTVTLEFEVGTDLDQALVRVANGLGQVPRYPAAAREPVLSTASSTGPPLAVLLLRSKSKADVGGYRTYIGDEIVPALERVQGVAAIRFFGGRDAELEVLFDPSALAARQVTLGQVAAAVQAQLSDISAGDVDLAKRRYLVRTMVAPEPVEELERTVLRVGPGGEVVRLGDVARVRMGLGKQQAYVIGDDAEALALLFDREAGSNVLEVTQEIQATVDRLQAEKLDALDLELRIVTDQVGYIEGALSLIRNNLLLGGAFAVVVLLFFLRSVSASAVVATAIPVCVIGTALGMSLLGRSVNVVSLAGMAFAVGLVVDNAIVVLEAIDTYRKQGMSPARAALEGTREVWGAIVASTATTAAVFIPIISWQDEVGELLRDVAIAITLAVGLSLIVSVLVIPSFSAQVMGAYKATAADPTQRLGGWLRDKVRGHAYWIAGGSFRGLAITGLAVSVASVVAISLLPPMEYLPTGNRNFLFGGLVPPSGYSLEEVRRIGTAFQADLAMHTGPEAERTPRVERSFFVARPGGAFMGGSALDPNEIGDLVKYYGARQREIPGVFGFASQASLFARSVGSSRAIDVELRGSDIATLIAVGGPMLGRLTKVLPGSQVRPIPSLDLGTPELRVLPRREVASALGVDPAEIGAMVDALVDGRFVGEFSPVGHPQVDVVLRAQGGGARTPAELAASAVATPTGRTVPLSTVADIGETVGPSVISRIERRRAITLQVTPPDEVALEAAVALIRSQVVAPMRDEGLIPADVDVGIAGSADDLSASKRRMAEVLVLAVIISFLLMAALFEDFVAPLVILVTVPLAAAGGVAALRFVDVALAPQPFDMMTALGFVILIGVVVNNAILVVDGSLARLREGMGLQDAIGDATQRRVRPIFMSTLTTLAGLLPLVIFPGSGSELYRGIGAVVLGGLGLSTLLTLYVIPAAFSFTWRVLGRAR